MLKDLLRYKANPIRLGAVIMVIALILLGMAYMVNRTFTLTFWDKAYEVKADFTDADGIANASDVRMAGTYVGQITQIRSVQGGLAEITIRVDKQHSPLPEGTKANLRLQTLLGTKFIELVPGPSGNKAIAADSVIPSDSTQSPVDFDQLLSSFDKQTRDDLQKLVQEAGKATDGRGENINGLLASLHTASVDSNANLTTFGDRQQNLDSILVGLDNTAGNLSDNRQHLANVYTQLDAILATISTNDASFRRFIEQGNIGLGHGINQFDGQAQNINDIFRLLNPTLNKLNPILVNVNTLTVQFNPFIQILHQFAGDIASANSAYNANPSNTGNPNTGGWYLRQPVILAQQTGTGTDCERTSPPPGCPSSVFNPNVGPSPAAQAGAQPATSSGNSKPNPLPSLPLPLPTPKLPPLPILPTAPVAPSGVPTPGIPGLNSPNLLPPVGPLGTGLSMSYDSEFMLNPELALFAFLLGSGG
ncbi:MAG: phospholipid/cholesterol/gamma-HCH transport system substrate-binding protein [Chloroflexota bacterium]|jgi:phospholipid/cholesterol/gamma-HCH transport system substrate-binding protein|nr:phospholipid/cholesterol/gamma-HCH transport system substrate-binding protein [Chloroflexota bacterium]